MSAILHRGPDGLILLRQPQPTFQRQRRGVFDTGTRRFKCLISQWKNYLRTALTDGNSDVAILRFANGGTVPGEAQMYLDSVTIDQELGDSLILSVSYKGLLAAKPDDVLPGVELRTLSEVPTGGYVTPVTFTSPAPVVTHLYVSDRRPDVFEIGSKKTPPTFPGSQALNNYFTAYRTAQVVLFVGWILKSRLPVQCGKLFECVDTYAYETITAPTQ